MPTGGPNQQSILPNFSVFATPPPRTMPLVGRPPKQASAGIGVVVPPWLAMYSPVAAAVKITQRRQPQGVGQLGGMLGGAVVWAVVLGAGGWLSYQAGKAMAPSGSKKQTWGYIGIPVGLLTGHFGLGVMGFMSNRKG